MTNCGILIGFHKSCECLQPCTMIRLPMIALWLMNRSEVINYFWLAQAVARSMKDPQSKSSSSLSLVDGAYSLLSGESGGSHHHTTNAFSYQLCNLRCALRSYVRSLVPDASGTRVCSSHFSFSESSKMSWWGHNSGKVLIFLPILHEV